MKRDRQSGFYFAIAIFGATVLQLAVATFASGLPQFEGKAFGSRLVAYPLMMLIVPVTWGLLARNRGDIAPVDWAAVAFLMAPFLVDDRRNRCVFGNPLGTRRVVRLHPPRNRAGHRIPRHARRFGARHSGWSDCGRSNRPPVGPYGSSVTKSARLRPVAIDVEYAVGIGCYDRNRGRESIAANRIECH